MQYTTYTHTDAESYLTEVLEQLTEWYGDDTGAILSAVVEDAWWVVDRRDEIGLYDVLASSQPMRWRDGAYGATGLGDARDRATYERIFVEAMLYGAREMLGLA